MTEQEELAFLDDVNAIMGRDKFRKENPELASFISYDKSKEDTNNKLSDNDE